MSSIIPALRSIKQDAYISETKTNGLAEPSYVCQGKRNVFHSFTIQRCQIIQLKTS